MSPSDKPNRNSTEKEFFTGKRPWSRIKDQVLGSYLRPYLAKVALVGQPIILVDAFAGPGQFGVHPTTEPGSPKIFCEVADGIVPSKYQAIFVNRNTDHHKQLTQLMDERIKAGKVFTLNTEAENFLRYLQERLSSQTLFLYLDPFGLKGCEFSTLEPLLKRDKRFSTEMVINISVPTIFRLGARVPEGATPSCVKKVKKFNATLSNVLGGDYWKDILWNDDLSHDEKAGKIIALYCEKLKAAGFSFTGFCPVREDEDSSLKYYITFCSRHKDALLLMNDIMCAAYHQNTHAAKWEGTLFASSDWKDTHDRTPLPNLILDCVKRSPGRSRVAVWLEIVGGNFMRYTSSEYKAAVKELCDTGKLEFEDVKETGRINDSSLLKVPV